VASTSIPRNDEWGEEVKSVIQLESGYVASEQLVDEIIGFLKGVLPGFKVPRSVEFVTELPRSDAGKIQRGRVREQYWIGRDLQI
jgi:long-chain acyl-CoA synthetase